MQVTYAESTAADLLVSLAAVADRTWRDTFASGNADHRVALDAGGQAYVRRVMAFGRFGFLNLLGVLPETRSPHNAAALLDWVRRTPAAEVHLTALGGRRRQLLDLVPDPGAALRGDTRTLRALRAAFASDETVVNATRWLLGTPSDAVRDELLDVLGIWRTARYPARAERALAATLQDPSRQRLRWLRTEGLTPVEQIQAVAGGLTYEPPSAASVLLLEAPSAYPIVVVVDDVHGHVIAYPPPRSEDPRERLLALTRALGDETRLAVLAELRGGRRTATELIEAVDTPRTSLLHHLATLRAAGLITTSVGPYNTTLYALRRGALRELRQAAVTVLR
jgi:DNA-binding transcriptional ArsR family regulator